MGNTFQYDVFLSHAAEDKAEIGDLLHDLLLKSNVKVWYSGKNMEVGQDLDETILNIIPHCKYCVPIISHDFCKSYWPRKELNAFHSSNRTRDILPVWHNIDRITVARELPYLVDKYAARSKRGIDQVAAELIKAINKTPAGSKKRASPPLRNGTFGSISWLWWAIPIGSLFILSLVILFLLNFPFTPRPPKGDINKEVKSRITTITNKSQTDYDYWLHSVSARRLPFSELLSLITEYTSDHKCNRGEYSFHSQNVSVNGLKKVESTIGFNPVSGLFSGYSINDPKAFAYTDSAHQIFSYVLIDTSPITYDIDNVEMLNDKQALCRITYKNNLRYVKTEMGQSTSFDDCNWIKTEIHGLKPVEEYVFEKHEETWVCTGIKP